MQIRRSQECFSFGYLIDSEGILSFLASPDTNTAAIVKIIHTLNETTLNFPDFTFERIMIIDDNKLDRFVASHIFKKNSFVREIIEFDTATKAVDYLEANRDRPELLPQLMLLDINMPEMDGFQFLEHVSLLPEIVKQSRCIVMLSTFLNAKDHTRLEKIPVIKKLINKPLHQSNLEEIEAFYFEEVLEG